jgi:hypothetical protein
VRLAIGDGLKESKTVGFVWGIDDDFHWAFCDACEHDRLRGKERRHRLVPLCRACFEEAWELNGKPEKLK